jgi:hypothetical protein
VPGLLDSVEDPGGSQLLLAGWVWGCACYWRTTCFACWVSSLSCAQNGYLPMRVRAIAGDSLLFRFYFWYTAHKIFC